MLRSDEPDGPDDQEEQGMARLRIEGLDRVLKSLKGLEAQAEEASGARLRVGYSAPYALIVHEDLTKAHPKGQAKFLEQPARALRPELARIIRTALRRGRSMREALLLAGTRLMEESQKLVPVRTGALRDSAFTRVE